ncbi:Basic immunoglobulin-like variable motif-containing protein [Trypanosoma grayi]|uniref:Basic immunoglobulin-like variable motif-containing protein n=1 Tax=Trypanosoma grayi TaxID=71804 RepID=UPI0004F46862|nr:Basic immunoglobulin-like variable motif-containing protein [Trypanosoma grayi]KEG11239.1 Basic immunoglobulin-like variable motif-containing protein [Trypanosoma grayi]
MEPTPSPTASPTDAVRAPPKGGEAWGIDFTLPKMRRKITKKERDAVIASRLRQQLCGGVGEGQREAVDSEGNRHLPVVCVDGLADVSSLVPTGLATTRADLEHRMCLRLPRLLAVTKQYPRSCGVSSLTSVWNYLYTRIGEAAVGANRPPVAQEEIMSILGFAPPFDEIAWGPFTGNRTLFRWFHAINRHFGVSGRAYVLYKPQGRGRTSSSAEEALQELKRVLRDPHAAVVYHCHNHYMVPIGYQEIPRAQTDFYAKDVPEEDSETTVFIGEVSRGRHDAMYARRWSEIVKDLMCRSPQFYNIRRPELGIQTRAPKKKRNADKNNNNNLSEEDIRRQEEQPQKQCQQQQQQQGVEKVDATVSLSPQMPTTLLEEPFATSEATDTAVAAAAATTSSEKKKTGGGNLHCLLCFRSDEVEEHPERYENPSSSSSSSSSGDDDDASDAEDSE